MQIFGSVECYKCNELVDSTGCVSRTVEVESGRSGGAWSIGGSGRSGNWASNGILKKGVRKSKGASIRYNTGRTYYKKVQVYVCPKCLMEERKAKEASEAFWGSVVVTVLFFALLWGMWIGMVAVWNRVTSTTDGQSEPQQTMTVIEPVSEPQINPPPANPKPPKLEPLITYVPPPQVMVDHTNYAPPVWNPAWGEPEPEHHQSEEFRTIDHVLVDIFKIFTQTDQNNEQVGINKQ